MNQLLDGVNKINWAWFTYQCQTNFTKPLDILCKNFICSNARRFNVMCVSCANLEKANFEAL